MPSESRRHTPDLASLVRTIPDHPKPGIQFRDVTTLFADPWGFRASVDGLVQPFLTEQIDYVAGVEARGFILAGAVARELGRGFVPVRKAGKLPGRVLGRAYALEYGTDTIELDADQLSDGDKVLLIDDLIATGGTALAAAHLIQDTGARVIGAAFVIDLPDLGGATRLEAAGIPVHTLIAFDGD